MPNLFMVGFPKAGSTSLARWMAAHPRIGLGIRKETKFLLDENNMRRMRTSYWELGVEGYPQVFQNIPYDHAFKYLMDADVHYYDQRTALDVISELPDARIILLLREPVSRFLSVFRFTKNNEGLIPEDMSFADYAARRQKNSAAEMWNAFGVRSRSGFPELCYVEYLALWQNALGRDRITYVFFEHLVKSPRAAMARVMQELGLQHEMYDDFPFGNERPTNTVLNHRLHRMLLSLKRRNRAFFERLRPLKPFYERVNYSARKPPLSEREHETIAWMNDLVRPCNDELRCLTGVDALPWQAYASPHPVSGPTDPSRGMRDASTAP